jgi:hypothetical protein
MASTTGSSECPNQIACCVEHTPHFASVAYQQPLAIFRSTRCIVERPYVVVAAAVRRLGVRYLDGQWVCSGSGYSGPGWRFRSPSFRSAGITGRSRTSTVCLRGLWTGLAIHTLLSQISTQIRTPDKASQT